MFFYDDVLETTPEETMDEPVETALEDSPEDGSDDFAAKDDADAEAGSDDLAAEDDADAEEAQAELGSSVPEVYLDADGADMLPAKLQFTPDMNSPAVVGAPLDNMQNWQYQEVSGPCATYAQMFALENQLQTPLDPNELIQRAQEEGWCNSDGSTPCDDLGNLLEAYGMEVERREDCTIQDIEHCLAIGGSAVVAVDGDEIWHEPENEFFFLPGSPNHAVQVIGLDYNDREHPMVILNDSGTPNGRGLMVPLAQFQAAWEDSDCYLVEAYLPRGHKV